MRYISTRGESPAANFREVLLGGLASDGGLLVPESIPRLNFEDLKKDRSQMSYPQIAVEVMHPYMEDFIEKDKLQNLAADAYGGFTHPEVAPLKYVEEFDFYLLELFHGPTLAFKDMALQLVGALFEYALQETGDSKTAESHSTILTATSGDTGAAAIYACLGKKNLSAFILHPEGLVSEMQRKMMTSVDSPNIRNIAIQGNFDDCQKLVKGLFQDPDLASLNLAAMNSINWARIAAQAAYYFWALLKLPQMDAQMDSAVFSVPSGNFGNVYSGWVAAQMGAPIEMLIAAVNKNDTLARFINTGELDSREAVPTLAPAMDVSLPSNLERLIFEMLGRKSTADFYAHPQNSHTKNLSENLSHASHSQNFKNFWAAYSIQDESGSNGGIQGGIRGIIQEIKAQTGLWIDPHTAVGVGALLKAREERHLESPQVVISTAHPAKFESLYLDFDNPPVFPENFSDLKSREEKYDTLPPDLQTLKNYVMNTQIS